MDLAGYVQFVVALALVLALIAGLGWLVKRSGIAGTLIPSAVTKGAGRRLGVVEVLPLDPRRKLVLLRCDAQEHLVLLNQGPAPDLLIAGGLAAPAAAEPEGGGFAAELERQR